MKATSLRTHNRKYFSITTVLFIFKALCPVCREPIPRDMEELESAAPPKELENAQQFEITSDLRKLQAQMRDLYIHQKNRGGIIDVDAEENKLLLITNSAENNTFQADNVN